MSATQQVVAGQTVYIDSCLKICPCLVRLVRRLYTPPKPHAARKHRNACRNRPQSPVASAYKVCMGVGPDWMGWCEEGAGFSCSFGLRITGAQSRHGPNLTAQRLAKELVFSDQNTWSQGQVPDPSKTRSLRTKDSVFITMRLHGRRRRGARTTKTSGRNAAIMPFEDAVVGPVGCSGWPRVHSDSLAVGNARK